MLEIKESMGILSNDILEKTFNMLKYMGVKIAIDDFGYHAFSLHHLKQFPVHYLRLNQFFIGDIEYNAKAVALVKSVMFLAKKLSMQIIIQGVESDSQLTALKDLECTLMQGKLLGAPLLEEEVQSRMVMQPL